MKNIPSFFLLLVVMQSASCQTDTTTATLNDRKGEFTIYSNGLIYPEMTMSKLGHVVDSLNLRFKTCDVKTYRSLEQGYGTYVSFTKNIRKVREALNQNIKLEELVKKFKVSELKKNILITKEHLRRDGKREILYSSETNDYVYIYLPDNAQNDKSTGMIVEENENIIEVIYLNNLKSNIIPEEYAKLIQYVDCMIDTTATIFPKEQRWDSLSYFIPEDSKIKKFLDLAMNFEAPPKEPDFNGGDSIDYSLYRQYSAAYEAWDKLRVAALDEKMRDQKNMDLLNAAVKESLANQRGHYLDYYAGRYLPPKTVLELKRSFRVQGICSQDTGPRDHAKSICILAAETYQWDIFLRAHLDILNDNFDRASDGSYAWAARGTYVKELEELNINAVDLLIGTVLNSKDISENHYLAGAYRTGRALTESKDSLDVDRLLLDIVQDDRLDLFNRIIMVHTYIGYSRELKKEKDYRINLEKLKQALKTFPVGMDRQFASLFEN